MIIEYITKETVLKMLNRIENAVEDGEGYQFNEWVGYVEELPAEEVQPIVHKKCSIAYGMYENRIWCNNCGFIKVITGNENEYNFCPKCGAIVEKQNEMDGKEVEE